jgi:sialate O-acetylesterase
MFLFFVYSVITLMRIAESGEFVSNTLGSNMVIQRGKTSFIWGKSSAPGSEISIKVGDIFDVTTKSGETFSGGGFSYVAEVPAMGASLDPLTITVSSNVGESQIMTNVLVGDVFFCSGQSNMEFSMPGVFNASEEIAKADNYPNIRLFTVHSDLSWPQTCGNSPQDELCSVLQPWSVASADSIGSSLKSDDGEYNYDVWSKFSGVCWYFGVNTYVHQLHGNVPVGLIASAWGGTIIEAWTQPDDTSACRLEADPSSATVGDSAETHVSADFDPTQPGALFNSMVHPFRYFSIRGIVWYQGESNMRNSMIENDFYTCMQPRLLNTWRGMGPGFDGVNMVYTQVAPWTWHFTPQGYKGIYTFRQAQYNVLQRVPQGTMAMVTAADLGDPESPYSDIHPREKVKWLNVHHPLSPLLLVRIR